jgi:pimeloyl-ACP methyl ester carboxylesterase
MVPQPQPFTLHVPEPALDDLRARLALTRFPDQAPGEPWAYGADLEAVRGLVAHWRDGFDWRAQEARLNGFPQATVPLHGIDLHYLHVHGKGPDPCPLLLLHGWPGSVFEFLDIIPRLADPARFGGDPADSFTVVAPSLPGYGLSFKPGQKRFGVEEIADCVAHLMHDVLGFTRFAAQGGDWGGFTASRLGAVHPEKLLGIHINLLAVKRDPAMLYDPTPEEKRYLEELSVFLKGGDRLPVDTGHAAANPGLRADGQPRRPRRVDTGEVPRVVGLRRRPVVRAGPRPGAREHRALLVHRLRQRVLLALLRADARPLAHPGRAHRGRAHRLRRLSARDPAPAALARLARLHRHSAVDAHGARRPLRRHGAAGRPGARGARVLPPAAPGVGLLRAVGFTANLPASDPGALLDLDLPEPGLPNGRDLLVRVRAVSVNPRDAKSRLALPASPEKPVVAGYDASGVVEATGAEATLFRPGDEVFYAGTLDRQGSNAEWQLVDERIVGRKPAFARPQGGRFAAADGAHGVGDAVRPVGDPAGRRRRRRRC